MKDNKVLNIIVIVIIFVTAIFIKTRYFDFVSLDYDWFIKEWFMALKDNGGLAAIGEPISNYSPMYIYLLAFLTYIPINPLYLVKGLTVVFEILTFVFIIKIIYLRSKNYLISFLVGAIIFFLPTVILNGAVVGQCDIIFTSFLVIFIYYIIKEKPIFAIVAFSIAISFKLQGAFLSPLLLILLLNKRIKLWQLVIIPATYILSILPAYIMGRPFKEVLFIYFDQVGLYEYLTLNCPNIYYLIPNLDYEIFNKVGIIFTFILLLSFALSVYLAKKKLSHQDILQIAVIILIVAPFFLPQMHERYFFPAEILLVVLAYYNKRLIIPSAIILLATAFAYWPLLSGTFFCDMRIIAGAIFISLIMIIVDFYYNLLKKRAIKK